MASAGLLRSGRAVIEMSLDSQLVAKGFKRLLGMFRRFRGTLGRLSGGLGGGLIPGLGGGIPGIGGFGGGGFGQLFVGAGASAALAYPVKLAANIELATASLSVFTGGTEEARKILLELQQFSAQALLSPEDLGEGAALLLKYGIATRDAMADVKALAAISAGSSEEFQKLSLAFAQVASAGHLTGEEVRQFKNTAFNPLREIAERTGESMLEVRARMEAAAIPFAEVQAALVAATSAGGRFDGLLQAIAGTTLGQFRKAIAQLKLALLPLGEEVLPTISMHLGRVNDLITVLADVIQRNKDIALSYGKALFAAATAMAAFVAVGLTVRVLAFTIGGFALVLNLALAPLSLLLTLLGALLSPLGLVVTAVGTLAFSLGTSTMKGQQLAALLGGQLSPMLAAIGQKVREVAAGIAADFGKLPMIATEMLGGIRDAIAAGDLQLAAEVLWSGLKLIWLQGTATLRQTWHETMGWIKNLWFQTWGGIQAVAITIWENLSRGWSHTVQFIMDAMDGLQMFFVQSWNHIVAFVKKAWLTIKMFFQGTKKSAQELADINRELAEGNRAIEEKIANRVAERMEREEARRERSRAEQEAALEGIGVDMSEGGMAADAESDRAIAEAERELEEARRRFEEQRKKAAEAAKNATKKAEETKREEFAFGQQAAAGVASSTKPISLIDPRLAAQVFGHGDTVQDRQLEEQREIRKNTKKTADKINSLAGALAVV